MIHFHTHGTIVPAALLTTPLTNFRPFDGGPQSATQNYNEASSYITALTGSPDTVMDWRGFLNPGENGPGRIRRGTLMQVWSELIQWQSTGHGVFVAVNITDGEGLTKPHITTIRAHFIDIDDDDHLSGAAKRAAALAWSPAPHFEVWSSPGKYHAYWRIEPYATAAGGAERSKRIQGQLVTKFGSDNKVTDITRVLRVPGFFNLKAKYNRPLVQIYRSSGWDNAPYNPAAFEAALTGIEPYKSASGGGGTRQALGDGKQAESLERLKTALDGIDANCVDDRTDWFKIMCAVKQAGWSHADDATLLAIFQEWCASWEGDDGKKNDPGYVGQQWRSIKDTDAGWNLLLERSKLKALDMFGGEPGQMPAPVAPVGGPPLPEQSFEQMRTEAYALTSDNVDGIERLCAGAGALGDIKKELILKAISGATGITMTVLRKQSTEAKDSQPDQLELAKQALATIGPENIIHCDQDTWRYDNTGAWEICSDRWVRQRVQRQLSVERPVTNSLVIAVSEVLKNEIYIPQHIFNLGHPETVNCLNGEVSLDGHWRLLPHVREHYRTTQIPTAFDPAATAPQFWNFLYEIFRDDADRDDKVKVILEMFGYTLMSHANREKFIMLIGAGANGKSVLLAILEALVGASNVAGVQPSNFDNKFQRAHLHHKQANIVTELRQGETIADAELKAITSGEPATVEHKNKTPFEMRPYATCWFGTNHMPHTRDFSEAFFRRAIVVQFNRVFQPHEQDHGLKEKLKQELPGILNLALNAYAGVVARNTFTTPASSVEAQHRWKIEANQVAQFVDERCTSDALGRVTVDAAFISYTGWAQSSGVRQTVGKLQFGERLEKLGFARVRGTGGVRMIAGLNLVGPWGQQP